MVFFVCEHCNATLKKNQVDKHVGQCRNCWGVTCVDCSVTFTGDDFRAHTSCISEAQKYEGALYRPSQKQGQKKRSPQELWMDVIGGVVADSSDAPASLHGHIAALDGLGNVPRNKQKFKNFLSNSLKIRSASVADEFFDFLDKKFQAARVPLSENKVPNQTAPKRGCESEEAEGVAKKKKISVTTDTASKLPLLQWKRTMKTALKAAPSKQMRLKKLRREVLASVETSAGNKKVERKELKAGFHIELEKAKDSGWVKIIGEDVVQYLSSSQRK